MVIGDSLGCNDHEIDKSWGEWGRRAVECRSWCTSKQTSPYLGNCSWDPVWSSSVRSSRTASFRKKHGPSYPSRDKAKLCHAFFAMIFTNKVSQSCVLSDSIWGELPALDVDQVKDYLWEIGPYKSGELDGLYPKMLWKWVIQDLLTVFCKDNLHLKVSIM